MPRQVRSRLLPVLRAHAHSAGKPLARQADRQAGGPAASRLARHSFRQLNAAAAAHAERRARRGKRPSDGRASLGGALAGHGESSANELPTPACISVLLQASTKDTCGQPWGCWLSAGLLPVRALRLRAPLPPDGAIAAGRVPVRGGAAAGRLDVGPAIATGQCDRDAQRQQQRALRCSMLG